MPNEFLRRIASVQGAGLFSNDIKAKAEEMVVNKERMATRTINNTAKELDLLAGSADMKGVDARVEDLRNHPTVISSTKGIAEMAAKANEITNLITKKKEKYDAVYNSAIMSLGAIGGNEATRALNLIARKQGLTNKGLDKIASEIDLQVRRQKAYTGAVISNEQLLSIEDNKDHKRLVSIATESLLGNVSYQTLTSMALDRTSPKDLDYYENNKDRLINQEYEKLKDQGVTRKMIEDAFGVANIYTGKFRKGIKPTSPREDISYKDSLNNLKIYSELIKEAGCMKEIQNMLSQKEYAPPKGFEPGSAKRQYLEDILIGKDGAGGLYDKNFQTVLMYNPNAMKFRNIQDELRMKADEKGRIIPPEIDAKISTLQVPVDGDLSNIYMFNGIVALDKSPTYDPFNAEKVRNEVDSVITDKGTYLRPEDKPVSQSMYGGMYGGTFDAPIPGAQSPKDYADWQKVVQTYDALKNDAIPDNQQTAEFTKLSGQRKELYKERGTPFNNDYKTPLLSNMNYDKANKSALIIRDLEPEIVKYADKNNISQDLIRSVFYHEGRGDSNAKSPTGVRGHAQVTEDTFNDMKKYGRISSGYSYSDYLKDPIIQSEAGAAYLGYVKDYLLEKLPENSGIKTTEELNDLIRLGYNAGPSRSLQYYEFGILPLLRINNEKVIENSLIPLID